MPNKHFGWAPGKLILSGEHAVVYGEPAIAVPSSLGVGITLEEQDTPLVLPNIDSRLTAAWKEILPPHGYKLSIVSDLPIGCGMGSSAAISIATLRALAATKNFQPSFDWLFEQGFVMERIFHGTPSGLDHAVSAMQQALLYRKEGPVFHTLHLQDLQLLVIHSKEPKRTIEMVQHVRTQYPHNQSIIKDIGAITAEIAKAPDMSLKNLGKLITQNHILLQRLGVSTPTLDKLVEMACANGAYGAKLAGAGGGGICFALVDNSEPIQSIAAKMGYESFSMTTKERP